MGLEYSQVILKTFQIRESVKHSPQTDIHTNTTMYYKMGSSMAILSTEQSNSSCKHT